MDRSLAPRPRRLRPWRNHRATRLRALLIGILLLTVHTAFAASRPLLVTVDDLPLSVRKHPDPGERERITRTLLEILQRRGIRAVGLVTWGNMRDASDRRLLDLWLEAGHELGNHSFRHLSYTRTDADTYIDDIEHARRELASYLQGHGRELRFFRFPMLREGDTWEKLEAMRSYLDRTGQRNLPVTLDNQDWSFDGPWLDAARSGDREEMKRIGEAFQESLRLSVRHHERTGDHLEGRPLPQILLLHATQVGTTQWDPLFDWLERTGHRYVDVDEMLADPIFDEEPEYIGTHGPGLWDRHLALQRHDQARQEVRELLAQQARAWSRGDLETFCSVYADDAVFVSPSGITHGRQAVLDRYRRRYPDGETMGRLTLDVQDLHLAEGMEVSMLGDARPSKVHGVTVVARWRLERTAAEALSGSTVIVLAPTPDGWRIVRDASM